jgi:hypothetical protein
MGGLLLSVAINELCASEDYYEDEPDAEYQAFLEDPHRAARTCESSLAFTLKLAQSGLTVCLLVMIVQRFRMRIQQTRVLQQLKDRQVSHLKNRQSKSEVTIGSILQLVVELILCSVHQVPWYDQEWKLEALGRVVFYRSESVLCGFMFVRLYHVYLWQEASVFLKYFDLEDCYRLKDYKTIKLTQECTTSHRTLAFKVRVSFQPRMCMRPQISAARSRHARRLLRSGQSDLACTRGQVAMTRNPGFFILTIVGLLIISTTYLVRLSEGPARQPHSRYLWNQMWVTFTQATTGYGESVRSCMRNLQSLACQSQWHAAARPAMMPRQPDARTRPGRARFSNTPWDRVE